jgi:D-3-phosphoglycerate dehydrogenase / 2-oxoglutarate reductase
MRKIAVITPIKHLELEIYLESKGEIFYLEEGNKKQVRDLLIKESIEVILCNPNKQYYTIDKELLENSNVKLINTCSTGLSHIDISFCKENNIEVYSLTTDYELINNLPSTSELAFGLMVNMLRHINKSQEHVINYGWDYTKFMGRQIKDLKIGIIGYGRLGKLMHRYCEAFEAVTSIYDPYIKEYDEVSLENFISICDVISIHVHLNNETKNMINKSSLEEAKSDLLIINTSRGSVVNEADVLELLSEDKLGGYATDVLADENKNINNSILINAMKTNKKILITPHVGGMTIEGQKKAYKWAIEKL